MTLYYVDGATGNDAATGLSTGAAWETIGQANITLTAGDTVYIRTGVYADKIIPSNNGSVGNEITYTNYNNEVAEIQDVGNENAIDLTNKDYIVVDGIKIDGQDIYTLSTVGHWALLTTCTHVTIKNCTLIHSEGWWGVKLVGSSYCIIRENTMDHNGAWNKIATPQPNGDDAGDSLILDTDSFSNYVYGNTLTHGGHALVVVEGYDNVIASNILDNTYEALEGAGNGQRSGELKNVTSNRRSNFFINNICRNAFQPSDGNVYTSFFKGSGVHQVFRGNVFEHGKHIPITGIASYISGSGFPYVKEQRVCHNTMLDIGGPGWQLHAQSGALATEDCKFYNNIVNNTRNDPKTSSFDCDIYLNINNGNLAGSTAFNDCEIKGNSLVSQSAGDARININSIGIQTVTYYETNHPTNVAGNIETAPVFVSGSPTVYADYELDPASALLNAGVDLTTTNGSGTGTTITVHDALWFHDGFGVTGLAGDTIRVGSNPASVITAVNYSLKTITVDSSITWSDGDAVNLNYTGSGPDIGIIQSTTTTYYVDPAGTSGGSGTIGDPIDLLTANATATAGDTVRLLAGTYTTPIQPANSGALTVPITYENNAGEQVYIRVASGSYELDIDTVDYIEIHATNIGNSKGIIFGGTAINALGKNMRIKDANNIIINGIRHQYSDATNPGLELLGASGAYTEDVVVANSELYAHAHQDWNKGDTGTVTDQDKFEAPKTAGNGIAHSSQTGSEYIRRVLYKNCQLTMYGGNNPLDIESGDKILFSGCTFNNDWSGLVDGETVTNANGTVGSCLFLEGATCTVTPNNAKQGLEGAKSASMITKAIIDDSLLMVTGCLFEHMGYSPATDVTTNELQWRGYIHRYNVHYEETKGVGTVKLTTLDGSYSSNIQHQFYYNNTIVRSKNSGLNFLLDISATGVSVIGDIHYINNLHTEIGYRTDLETGTEATDASLAFNTLGDGTLNNVFDIDSRGNLFDSAATFYVSENIPTDLTLTQMESTFSSNFGDNINGTPTFKGGATTVLSAYTDFEITTESTGVDAGQHLTTTTSSGSATTSIPVTDAGYFFDGWGISDENGTALVGDVLYIEQAAAAAVQVTVTDVAYGAYGVAAGTLTVTPAITYASGAKIWIDHIGSAPDIGAIQNSEGTGASGGDPTYEDIYSNTSFGTTSVTVTPTGTVADGRLLIAFVACQENRTIVPPAGWTEVQNDAGSGSGSDFPRLYVFTRETLSETATYTFTTTIHNSRLVATIMEYSAPAGTPIEVDVVANEGSVVTSHDIAQLTGTSTNSDIVAVTLLAENGTNSTSTHPAGYTELDDSIVASGDPGEYMRLEVSRKAGTGGTVAATTSTSSQAAYSITYHAAIAGVNNSINLAPAVQDLNITGYSPAIVIEGGGDPEYLTAHSNSANGATQLTITPSATVDDGVMMLAIFGFRGDRTMTTLAGWTLVQDDVGAGTNSTDPHLTVYRKIASSEPSSYTFVISGTSRMVGAILEYANPNDVPIEVEALSAETVAATSHDIAQITGTTADADILAIVQGGDESADPVTTPPAGYTAVVNIVTGNGTPNKHKTLMISRKVSAGGTVAATTATTDVATESITYHVSILGSVILSDIDVNATTGALVISDLDATVQLVGTGLINATTGSTVIAGLLTTTTTSSVIRLDCTLGQIALTDYNADVGLVRELDILTTAAGMAVNGWISEISLTGTIDVNATTGALGVAGNLTDTNFDHSLNVTTGTLGVAGEDATIVLIFEWNVNATAGTVSVDQLDTVTQLIGDIDLTPGVGAITVDALDTTTALIFEWNVTATTGAIGVVGYDVSVSPDLNMNPETGGITIIGYDAYLNGEDAYGLQKETLTESGLTEETIRENGP